MKTKDKTLKPKKRKKALLISEFAFLCVFIFVSIYCLLLTLPYNGSLKISDNIKNSFSANNFLGQELGPERVMLLTDEKEAFSHRLNLIEQAKHEILYSSLTIEKGYTTKLFFASMLNAAEKNINISILLDGKKGGQQIPENYKYAFASYPNVSYYEYNAANILKPGTLNSAMHDKIFIIDNEYMIMGGRNMGDMYYDHDAEKGRKFIDNEVLVYNESNEGGVIAETAEYYNKLISNSASKKLKNLSSAKVSKGEKAKTELFKIYSDYKNTVNSVNTDYRSLTIATKKISLIANSINIGKKEPIVAYNLMELAKSSNNVIIQTPYIVLTNDDLKMFDEAVRSAGNVTILTNSRASTNTFFAYSNYYSNRKSYLKSGAQIYEFQSTKDALHTKIYLFDNRLTAIGSFNLDECSIRTDTESMLVIDSEELNTIAYDSMTKYFDSSLKVNNKTNKYEPSDSVQPAKCSFWRKLGMSIVGPILNLFKCIV